MINKKGLSLVEVMVATVIIGIVAISLVYMNSFMSKHSIRINERVFATQKAMQMMEELRSLVASGEKSKISILDDYDDGAKYKDVLTTNKSITDPANILSGNSGSKYLRQVSIIKLPEEPFARKVYVKVYKNSTTNPGTPGELLAEIVSILKTVSTQFLPTQVMDVYIISIENIPGWWSFLITMRPIFESVLQDFESRNPGLAINRHWITRLSYGRDKQYVPYINNNANTEDEAIPYVYFYPGLTKTDNGGEMYYYAPNLLKGIINIDGTLANSDSYVMCDQYNHAVRYPDELRIWNSLTEKPEKSLRMLLEEMNTSPENYKNALIINLHGELLPIVPMRNYSDAAKEPENFKYMRVVTHPEKIKYSSTEDVKLRVYGYSSQPDITGAKAILYNSNNFTSPKKQIYNSEIDFNWGTGSPDTSVGTDNFSIIWDGNVCPKYNEAYTFIIDSDDGFDFYFDNDTLPVINKLGAGVFNNQQYITPVLQAGKKYSIKLKYQEFGGYANVKLSWKSASQAQEVVNFSKIPVATVYFPNDKIGVSDITISKISGSDKLAYSKTVFSGSTELLSGTTCHVSWPNSSDTLITLYDTLVISSQAAGGTGLKVSDRLYGLDYIPCPIGNDFSIDLTNTSSIPKNTARWIITIKKGALSNGEHKIETRIEDDLTAGNTLDNQPPNLSATYVWIGVNPPVTEQYQFLGDARHCPYLDVKQSHGYNWFFRKPDSSKYLNFSKATDGYGGGDYYYQWITDYICDVDIPRHFQMYRQGLLNVQGILSNINGYSFYYVGVGGDFGYDKSPLINSINFNATPWSKTSCTTTQNVNEIISWAPYGIGKQIVAKTDNSWYAKFWLGELYMDDDYVIWQNYGNVPTGTGHYYRTKYTDFSDFIKKRHTMLLGSGCSSFFNGKSSGNTGPFKHTDLGSSETGNLTANVGLPMSSDFNYPLLSTVYSGRPFILDYNDFFPIEWNDSIYDSLRTILSIPAISGVKRVYYNTKSIGSGFTTSAVVKIQKDTKTAYSVVTGFNPQGDFGSAQIAKYTIMAMLKTFLDCGLYSGQDHIVQVPRVSFVKPTITDSYDNVSNIAIEWQYKWKRWDNEKYSSEYADTFSESEPLEFSLMYSSDQGRSWQYCSDNTPATAAQRKSGYTTTSTTFTWNVSLFPRGSYILRIECYRKNILLHYSYDQIQIYLNK